MIVQLDTDDLECLVKGSAPSYGAFSHPLLQKAGHFYSERYARHYWPNLGNLSKQELFELYQISKNSRK